MSTTSSTSRTSGRSVLQVQKTIEYVYLHVLQPDQARIDDAKMTRLARDLFNDWGNLIQHTEWRNHRNESSCVLCALDTKRPFPLIRMFNTIREIQDTILAKHLDNLGPNNLRTQLQMCNIHMDLHMHIKGEDSQHHRDDCFLCEYIQDGTSI